MPPAFDLQLRLLDHRLSASLLEHALPSYEAIRPLVGILLVAEQLHDLLQVFEGVVEVQYHDGERVVVVVDGPEPLASVGEEYCCRRHQREAPVEFAARHLAVRIPPLRGGDVRRRVLVAAGLAFLHGAREERRDLDLARLRLLPVLALDAREISPEHGYARAVAEHVGQRLALLLLDVAAREVDLRRGRRVCDDDVAHRVGGYPEPVRVLEFLRRLLVAVDRRQAQHF